MHIGPIPDRPSRVFEQLQAQDLDREQALILALVRMTAAPGDAARREEATRLSAGVDTEQLCGLLVGQRLFVTLGATLVDDLQLPYPERFTARFATARALARRRGLFHQAVTGRVIKRLAGHGISAVPLKGATLAEALYGDLGARESWDLDFLVAREQLQRAVGLLEELGWTEYEFGEPPGELPVLHRELGHPDWPPVELHWRVHWYETSFSREALERSSAPDAGWLQLRPADELAFLLLFLARDGLTGLRQAVDVAAWCAVNGARTEIASEIQAIAEHHPTLAPALRTAARFAEAVADLPTGSLMGGPVFTDSRPQTAALSLANPWLAGSPQQIAAEVSLMDGLLGPRAQAGAFIKRQIAPPVTVILKRQPDLANASAARILAARAGHAWRILGRYGLAVPKVAPVPPRVSAALARPRAIWASAQRT